MLQQMLQQLLQLQLQLHSRNRNRNQRNFHTQETRPAELINLIDVIT